VAEVDELMRDEAKRSHMGRRAREYAVRCHSVERMVSDYEALFRSLLTEGKPEPTETAGREPGADSGSGGWRVRHL
jgi:hypothetical protein